jgi:glycosyltransferase involved in cell wall biosynthesis
MPSGSEFSSVTSRDGSAVTQPAIIFRLGIVTPVFNDWESLAILLHRITELYRCEEIALSVVAVDDGSTRQGARLDTLTLGPSCIRRLEIVRLAANLGHQRAIAIGLVQIATRMDIDAVLVMDSDGEDRPEEIAALVAAARADPDAVILADRSKRSESLSFRLGYRIYKLLFRLLAGQRVSFGNFMIIPKAALTGLISASTLWNNLPATVIRSRYQMVRVPTIRGKRYAGESKMNLVALATHGFSAISVYVDVIFVRLLLFSTALITSATLAILLFVGYKLFTDLATPGWTTTVVSTFLIIILQASIFMIGTTLMLLSGRSNYMIVPALDWRRYVEQPVGAGAEQGDFAVARSAREG